MSAKHRIARLRNLGVIAHIDAGKTTTTERILFFSGSSHRVGAVDEGTAVMDWMDQERERGITITSAVTTFEWKDHTINLVDTPGHVDFTAEVQRSLRVLDGAVVVICGVGGVEPQSEKVWHQASEFRVPRIVYVNKLDRLGADFAAAVEDLEDKLDGTFVPLLLPLGKDSGYLSAVDLLEDRLLTWAPDDENDEPTVRPVPDDVRAAVDAARERIVEAAAVGDESVLDDFLETGNLDVSRAVPALRSAVLTGSVHPVLCGTALKSRGVRRLLDAVLDYLPSPLDVPPVIGRHPNTDDEVSRNPNPDLPLAALVYKVMNDESRNRLFYARVYAGTLKKGGKIFNATIGAEERVTRVYRMHSNRKEALETAVAGDIVGLVGPKRTRTGDTLCPADHPLLLERIEFPDPVIAVAIEPKSQGDLADLEKALEELAVEDPTFVVRDDPETGQKIVSGMGELHLQVLVERLAREFRVEARVGDPQVSYRETIRAAAAGEGKFDREIGDKPNRAKVRLRVEPQPRSAGLAFLNALPDGEIPAAASEWIQDAVRAAAGSGPFAGYALVDVRVTLEGAELPGDAATETAVRGAAAEAFRKAITEADPILLEPVVRLEVLVPEEYTGEVLKDLNARRSQVTGTESRGALERVAATVPLARTFGYATDLRSATRGRGSFSMEISHFEPAEEAMKRFRT